VLFPSVKEILAEWHRSVKVRAGREGEYLLQSKEVA